MSVNKSKMVRASKDHRCNLCGKIIRKGARYWYNHEFNGEEWVSFKSHEGCLYKLAKMEQELREIEHNIRRMEEEFIGAPPEVVTEDGLFIRKALEFYG